MTTPPVPASGPPGTAAAVSFLLFAAAALAATWWAARRTRAPREFYAAGRSITALPNGLALAGDYMSAASLLGIAGLVSLGGFDGLIYSVGFLVGWPLLTFLLAEPLRNLGRYTFADVVAYRLGARPVRAAAALGSLATVLVYLVAQMVGAGALFTLVFGLRYEAALALVATLMIAYVLFGGRLATTWVQITKAVLLLGGASALVLLTLARFDWSLGALFLQARELHGPGFLAPGGLYADPVDALSLGLALMLGTAGLPHILMRFYTVPDAREARASLFYATGLIGYFYLLTVAIGFGAAALVGAGAGGGAAAADPGGNLAAPLLAGALGGEVLLGVVAAIAFATILAVVAGLTLAGATALARDLYVGVLRRGRTAEREEMRVARAATALLGVAAALLALALRGVNVAVIVGLAFAVAASANFPALLLSIVWRRFTTRGAVASILTGLAAAVTLTVLGPAVWEDVLHRGRAIFAYRNPGLFSIGAAFLAGILVSLAGREPAAEERFAEQRLRAYVGVGAD